MQGFLKGSILAQTKAPKSTQAACGACGLYKKCLSPKMQYAGQGKRGILIVVDFPTESDDMSKRLLTGDPGALLKKELQKCGVDVSRDCWVTSALICAPKGTNVDGTHVGHCQPNLRDTIRELDPRLILTFGDLALRGVLNDLWKEDSGPLSRWVGFKIPVRSINTWLAPNFAPQTVHATYDDDVSRVWFSRWVKEAIALEGRPWEAREPAFNPKIDMLYDPTDAAVMIHKFTRRGYPIAFDYECNMLKPDSKRAEIVCCSVSDGKKTIAYPWIGEAISATSDLLRSPVPKVGANIKFEERWSIAHLGHRVRGWWWDVMQAAHILDGRQGVTGLKFQTFVELGVGSYNDHIEQFLRSENANVPSRIREEIDLDDLLRYCGIDSLVEFLIADRQMRRMRYPLPERYIHA